METSWSSLDPGIQVNVTLGGWTPSISKTCQLRIRKRRVPRSAASNGTKNGREGRTMPRPHIREHPKDREGRAGK